MQVPGSHPRMSRLESLEVVLGIDSFNKHPTEVWDPLPPTTETYQKCNHLGMKIKSAKKTLISEKGSKIFLSVLYNLVWTFKIEVIYVIPRIPITQQRDFP